MDSATEVLKWIVEVAVFAAAIYVVLRFLRETRGAGVVRGLSIILIATVIAFTFLIKVLALQHLELVFSTLAPLTILGLIIVFQPEIRRAIVHLGESPIFARFRRETRTVPRLLRGVARLSKDRVGALIAIEREASLADLTASGVLIDAEVNSFLVESMFARASPLHDGAVIIRENRIAAAKCVLPLSESAEIDRRLGTRHRAAIGLSEESDALAVVVSEETGKISYALGGKLRHDVSLEDLEQAMEAAFGLRQVATTARGEGKSLVRRLTADPWRKLVAASLAVGLWFWLDAQINVSTWRECRLRLVDRGRGSIVEPSLGPVLDILVPRREFSAVAFLDPTNGDRPIESVSLKFEGPKALIKKLDADERAMMEPTPAQLDPPVFEFDQGSLTFDNDAFADALVSMMPERVKVVLARNRSRDLRLSHDYVFIRPPDPSLDQTFTARLDPKSARFDPETITLRGTESGLKELDKALHEATELLFELDFTSQAKTTQREVKAELRLRPKWQELGIAVEQTPVEVVIPLRPEFKPFELEVPGQLVTSSTRFSPADFEPLGDVKVTLKAASPLDVELDIMDEQELRAWARRNLVVLVVLPETATLDRDVNNLQGQLVFFGDDSPQTGADYQVEIAPLTVKPKKP